MLIQGPNSYFGEEEIIGNLSKRISKASVISDQAEIMLITKDVNSSLQYKFIIFSLTNNIFII